MIDKESSIFKKMFGEPGPWEIEIASKTKELALKAKGITSKVIQAAKKVKVK